jgi:hypothetical protein
VNVVTLTLCIVAISCGAYPETLDGVDDAASDPPELFSEDADVADEPVPWVTVAVEFVSAEIIRVRVGAVVGVVAVVVVGVVAVVVGVVAVVVGVVAVVVGVVGVVVVGVVAVVVGVTVVAATATPLAEPGFTTAT